MYDNTELKILNQIYLNPGVHKRELSKQLKIGMPSIDYALNKINSVIIKKPSGNQIKYYLDYSKSKLTGLLTIVESLRFENLPSKIKLAIQEFVKELEQKPIIILIFGSYAKGNYSSNSDIDILLIFQVLNNEKSIETIAKRISLRTNVKINPIYLDYNLFRESFHDPRKEFFRNIRKDKLILMGFEYWRQLENEET